MRTVDPKHPTRDDLKIMSEDPMQTVPYATPVVGGAKRGNWPIITMLLASLLVTLTAAAVLGYLLFSGKQVQISTNVTAAPPAPVIAKITPTLGATLVEMTVQQRQTVPVPGSKNTVLLNFSDITRGQVTVTVMDANGQVLMPASSLSEGATGTFTIGKKAYDVTVKKLNNKLVGRDFGTVSVGPTTRPAK
jgi:hypothetical protein